MDQRPVGRPTARRAWAARAAFAALVTLVAPATLATLALGTAGCSLVEAATPVVVTLTPTPTPSRTTPPAPPEPELAVASAAVPVQLPAPEPVTVVEDQVFVLVNEARAAAGLAPLERTVDLDAVARGWSDHLATQGLSLAHNPDYSTQIPSGWHTAGENVGWIDDRGTFTPEEVAARIHQGWMDSPGHRANLLNPAFTHIGVGVAHSAEHGWYLTQDFAGY